jgi:hypothetical protein
MSAMVGHNPVKYVPTPPARIAPAITPEIALIETSASTALIFFSTVERPSVTPNELRIELAYRSYRH